MTHRSEEFHDVQRAFENLNRLRNLARKESRNGTKFICTLMATILVLLLLTSFAEGEMSEVAARNVPIHPPYPLTRLSCDKKDDIDFVIKVIVEGPTEDTPPPESCTRFPEWRKVDISDRSQFLPYTGVLMNYQNFPVQVFHVLWKDSPHYIVVYLPESYVSQET